MRVSKFLRFSDLREMGVVRNWVTLGRWIEKEGFPPGLLLGPNTRVWPNDQVEAWIAGRPERREDPPPQNVKGDGPARTGTAARKPKPPSSPTNISESIPTCQASSTDEEAA
jgi:predicted DNA-binding transcriptional regulator AlpA